MGGGRVAPWNDASAFDPFPSGFRPNFGVQGDINCSSR